MSKYQRNRKRAYDSDDNYINKKRCLDVKHRLPVYSCKYDLLDMLEKNQIVIVTGETGSGKSTQIPQYLIKAGYSKTGKIACTQPRRVGAISLANRVCEEIGCAVGQDVGYSIRFENCASELTSIVYMTDGVLLRELQTDPQLSEYSVIMIDEAHERTIQTDALLGIMKGILKSRPSLRLIISSATINAEKFGDYYGASIFRIKGRMHQVKIAYEEKPSNDYMDDIVARVVKIHRKGLVGDILIFLAGQEDIDECVQILKERKLPDLYVLPAYSSLTRNQLSQIFAPARENIRKVVVATNIAETSLTIDGIQFVIDSGFVKQKTYNPFYGIDQLLLTVISRAQADQRTGRAGRTSNGKCYRMYTRDRYERKMLNCSIPEIQRANLANTVLQLKSIGIADVTEFDFIDAPDRQRLSEAVRELRDMSALSEDGRLTVLGRYMAQLPLDPILAKILIMSAHRHCSDEMLIVVAMLCVQNIFERPRHRTNEAERCRQSMHRHQGDHVTLLAIFLAWRDNDFSEQWCRENFLRCSGLQQALNIRQQLSVVMDQCGLPIVSCGPKIVNVQNTLALYYFRRNAARKEPSGGYRTVADDQIVYMHPSSALFKRQPEWVVFHDIMATSNKYMREVTKINAAFLKELLPSHL